MSLINKAQLVAECLPIKGEREFPMQLASTFFYIAANDGCRQQDLVNATSMSQVLYPEMYLGFAHNTVQ